MPSRSRRWSLLAGALAFTLACAAALPARAIPVFARRYQTACTTCHVLPPQLNSFGQAFRANGYRMPAGEGRRQEKDIQLGAPEWEGLFPNAILPGTVSDVPPIAGALYSSFEADRGKAATESTSVFLEVLTGGNLGKRVSYFASAGVGQGFATAVRAFASFDHLSGTWLNARAGYLEPAAVPFSRYTHRLGYEGYLAFDTNGPGGHALSDSRPALEVYGAGSDPGPLRGLQYSAGLATHNAVGGVAADGYARVSYKLGGIAPAGDTSGEPGRMPGVAPLSEESVRLGAYFYRATLGGPDSRPRGLRAGADADLLWGRLEAYGSAWLGSDSPGAAGASADSWALLAGASVRAFPWLMFLGRYEATWIGTGAAQRRLVATGRAAVQQNVALSLDFVLEMPDAASSETIGSLFLAF